LFLHLFHGLHFATETCELSKLLLNALQPFVSLSVSELGFCSVLTSPAILLVQIFDLGNLGT